MGCTSSKRIEAAVDVYRPAPSSFAVFDINAIDEPWVKVDDALPQHHEKPPRVPAPILEKLEAIEAAPRPWDEVSKALNDLKPPPRTSPSPKQELNPVRPAAHDSPSPQKRTPRKSFSFHTLEELDAKVSSKPNELRRTESSRTELKKIDSVKQKFAPAMASPSPTAKEEHKPLKENIFLVWDRLEREKEGKSATIVKFDPLSDFPEKCPPGGADTVVLYTTSLGGVRRTFEDCNKVRTILESHRVVFDERDVALHGEFRHELKELMGAEEGAAVPRMFVKGRYVGGVEDVVNLNETGRLGRILSRARVERGVGRLGCEGCGGARFVPCLDCGGSCKVVVVGSKEKERCPKCNENGLVHCPACL